MSDLIRITILTMAAVKFFYALEFVIKRTEEGNFQHKYNYF